MIRSFLRDRAVLVLVVLCVAVWGGMVMFALSAPLYVALLTGGLYVFGVAFALTMEYRAKRAYYRNALAIFDSLDKKRYIAEVMEPPVSFEGEIWANILSGAAKSMNDEIAKQMRESSEYREYVELWVHEIKTPISGAQLICENRGYQDVAGELARIDKFVEQALFYARSGAVEKDYVIKECNLKSLVSELIKKNAAYLIARKIRVENHAYGTVCTDPKWLEFILRQLLDNSVKYGAKAITYTFVDNTLTARDDGIGIPEKDLPRVFERGFTGENGRTGAKSTGMGLYLCKKLCDKMGLGITASSPNADEGVAITITFPQNPFVSLE